MEDILKIIKSLEECGLLIKGVTEIVENGAKEQKRANLVILFSSLGASLSENKWVGNGVILVLLHHLTNLLYEINLNLKILSKWIQL